jgi:hypothetical protein
MSIKGLRLLTKKTTTSSAPGRKERKTSSAEDKTKRNTKRKAVPLEVTSQETRAHKVTRRQPAAVRTVARRQPAAARKPPAPHLKAIRSEIKRLQPAAAQLVAIDPVAWAGNVMAPSTVSLARSHFRTVTTTIPLSGSKAPHHRCQPITGVADFGVRQDHLSGLDRLGRGCSGMQETKGGEQFLFGDAAGAIDHMLFSIILFHQSDRANRARARLLQTIFAASENENFACVTKTHAKLKHKRHGPFFCLAKAGSCVYVVLLKENRPPSILPYCID